MDAATTTLVMYARRLGLDDEDLAETVLDVANDEAARKVNAGGDLDTEHDSADQNASNVLNGGLDESRTSSTSSDPRKRARRSRPPGRPPTARCGSW